MVQNLPSNTKDPGSIPRLGWSLKEGNGYPLQYSCLENPMDREAWWPTVHGVAKSQTWLSDYTYLLTYLYPCPSCFPHIEFSLFCRMYGKHILCLFGLVWLLKFIFYWRIIALQNFIVFCQISTWISHRHTYNSSLLNLLPSPSPSHPSRLIHSPCLSFLSHTANSHWLPILHMVM